MLSHTILPVEFATSTPPEHAGAAGRLDDSSNVTVVPGISAAAAATASRATAASHSRHRTRTLASPSFRAPCTINAVISVRYRPASALVSASFARASSTTVSIACARALSTFNRIAFRPVDASIFFAVSTVVSFRSYSFAILIFSPSTMESFSMLNSSSVAMAISRAFSFASCLMNCTICACVARARRSRQSSRVDAFRALGFRREIDERWPRAMATSSRRDDGRRDGPG